MRVCCYQGVNKGAISRFVELANKGSKGYLPDRSPIEPVGIILLMFLI